MSIVNQDAIDEVHNARVTADTLEIKEVLLEIRNQVIIQNLYLAQITGTNYTEEDLP